MYNQSACAGVKKGMLYIIHGVSNLNRFRFQHCINLCFIIMPRSNINFFLIVNKMYSHFRPFNTHWAPLFTIFYFIRYNQDNSCKFRFSLKTFWKVLRLMISMFTSSSHMIIYKVVKTLSSERRLHTWILDARFVDLSKTSLRRTKILSQPIRTLASYTSVNIVAWKFN